MPVPDGMDVKVVENADNCVHITMPAPPTGSMELSDEELSNAAGGESACWNSLPIPCGLLTG
jgi:mersacidin/lichenicidin family type 2 lantibiotic